MGFFKKNMEKMKKDMAAAKGKYNEKMNEQFFVCPECSGTMKPVVIQLGGTFAKQRVRCEDCKLVMTLEDAKHKLKHPE